MADRRADCRVCGWRPVARRDLCDSCRIFERRHGRDRTVEEVLRNWELAIDRAIGIQNYRH